VFFFIFSMPSSSDSLSQNARVRHAPDVLSYAFRESAATPPPPPASFVSPRRALPRDEAAAATPPPAVPRAAAGMC